MNPCSRVLWLLCVPNPGAGKAGGISQKGGAAVAPGPASRSPGPRLGLGLGVGLVVGVLLGMIAEELLSIGVLQLALKGLGL